MCLESMVSGNKIVFLKQMISQPVRFQKLILWKNAVFGKGNIIAIIRAKIKVAVLFVTFIFQAGIILSNTQAYSSISQK